MKTSGIIIFGPVISYLEYKVIYYKVFYTTCVVYCAEKKNPEVFLTYKQKHEPPKSPILYFIDNYIN